MGLPPSQSSKLAIFLRINVDALLSRSELKTAKTRSCLRQEIGGRNYLKLMYTVSQSLRTYPTANSPDGSGGGLREPHLIRLIEEKGLVGETVYTSRTADDGSDLFQDDYPTANITTTEGTMTNRVPLILGSLNARIVRTGDPVQRLHGDILEDLMKKDRYEEPRDDVHSLDAGRFYTGDWGDPNFPGTHKSGINPPPEDRAIKHVLTATAPAGSVLVFNGQCWHGGGANTGDRDRHAIFGDYRISPMMRFQLDRHHRFPEEWLDLLTDRQKQLLRKENGVGVPHGADHYE